MFEFKIDTRGRARVWLQELPDYRYMASETLERQVPVFGDKLDIEFCAALELLRFGGTNPYALLGVRFVPLECDNLTIRVPVSGSDGEIVPDSIARKLDRVRVGLPMEYGGYLMDAAVKACSGAALGPGVLTIECAAHGEVGSSQFMFGRVVQILVQLLQLKPDLSQEAVEEIVGELVRSPKE